jgi:hypothetical protein
MLYIYNFYIYIHMIVQYYIMLYHTISYIYISLHNFISYIAKKRSNFNQTAWGTLFQPIHICHDHLFKRHFWRSSVSAKSFKSACLAPQARTLQNVSLVNHGHLKLQCCCGGFKPSNMIQYVCSSGSSSRAYPGKSKMSEPPAEKMLPQDLKLETQIVYELSLNVYNSYSLDYN